MKKSIFLYLTLLLATGFLLLSGKGYAQITSDQEIYNQGIDDFNKKRYFQAIDNFNVLIDGNKTGYLLYAYMYRAYAKNELGQFQNAITDFTTALTKYPNNADLLNGRAWSHCFAGNYNAAISDANKAISISKQAGYYDTRGTAYALLRSNSSAIADFNESIKLGAKPLYYYKRGLVKKYNLDYTGAGNDFATAKALDKTESYLRASDPLILAYNRQSYGTTSLSSGQGTASPTVTPMALSSSKYKVSFGKWNISFPGKPVEQTSSNSTFSTNYTAHYQSGEWTYMLQYIEIDRDYFKKYLLNDFLKDIRQQYAKNINGTISSESATTMKGFDEACNYNINTGGQYGSFKDGIVDYVIVRFGVFNTKRYPSGSEFYEFYNTFSGIY